LNHYPMTIKLTIKANSKFGQYIIKRMAEKKALREAVANGNYVEYCKKNNIRFDNPFEAFEVPESPLFI
jgi:hypothetical protein